ncbi:MAG: hypothetical protein NC225_12315 [Clostridium sp.]|nr:hypothetical protein [Clostridium sp.]MCM1400253.1 hypothetical protein [Clostridium sp.]MCM1460966.1 hypothetical protein [Bacteroides sp.]
MKLKDIKDMLSVPGVTVWYNHAPAGTKVPFVTYTCHSDNNFFADNKVYKKKKSLRAVLYSDGKNEELEELLEKAMDAAELPWSMTDSFDAGEQVFMTIYESEVI